MAEDFYQSLEQVRLAGATFADKNINKAVAVKVQSEVFEIFVLADIYRFQAHDISL